MNDSEAKPDSQGELSSVLLGEMHERFEQALNLITSDFENRQSRESPTIKGPVTIGKTNRAGYTYLVLRMPEAPEIKLTGHQRDILRLVSLGLPDKAIADELHLSAATIGVHLKRLNQKAKVHSRTAVVMRCLPYMRV